MGVLYTGAGISAAAGITTYAKGSGMRNGRSLGGARVCQPTLAHRLLGHLGRANLVHAWVQQNHDGLPQKAGFPQEKINEIHGSWYDPSNPVVKMDGYLRDHENKWLKELFQSADLVITLGTSMSHLHADGLATAVAERSLKGKALGTVTINLQQTPKDGEMTLRMFGKCDDVLGQLCRVLSDDISRATGMNESDVLRADPPLWIEDVKKCQKVLVPYDEQGLRLAPGSNAKWMWLDLSDGKKVTLTKWHNMHGCRQPRYVHIGAEKDITCYGLQQMKMSFNSVDEMNIDIDQDGVVRTVKGLAQVKGVQKHWKVRKIIQDGREQSFDRRLWCRISKTPDSTCKLVFDVPEVVPAAPLTGKVTSRNDEELLFNVEVGGCELHLGLWWLEVAARGAVPFLPIVNVEPDLKFDDKAASSASGY